MSNASEVDLDEWDRMEAQCVGGRWERACLSEHMHTLPNGILAGEEMFEVVPYDVSIATSKGIEHEPFGMEPSQAEAVCYFRNNARAMSAELRRLRLQVEGQYSNVVQLEAEVEKLKAENEELEDRIAELHLLAGGHAL